MNKNIKTILLVVGIILLAYGFYTMVVPETKVAVGDVSLVEAQDNTNAYIAIALGILAVVLSLIKGSK
jgi:membrane-bound ClpP family serine protease